MDSAAIDLQHQFYDMLMRSQYWPADKMRDYQRSQLTHLLRHAKKNVPFYENRLDAVLKPNGDIDWDRWGEIPIVKRSDLLEHREAMQARELPPGHGATGTVESSGSTGAPVKTTVNGLVVLGARVNLWRSNTWQGLDWSGKLYTRRHKNMPPLSSHPEGTIVGAWGPPWDEGARSGICVDFGKDSRAEEAVSFLARRPPDYLYIGAKLLQVYAIALEQLGLQFSMKAGLAHGERVGIAEREACQRVFGAPIFDLYSSKEGAQIAHPCEVNSGLHINAESILVEIINEDGLPCSIGVPGRVVITPFVSTAQPLIRYEQGDIAALGPPCSCGRSLAVLENIFGRVSAVFTHPDGRNVHRFFPEHARVALDCHIWQIAQTGATDFEVRYIPRNPSVRGDELAAAEIFRSTYFEDARVHFVRMTDLRTTEADKFLEYVNETTA